MKLAIIGSRNITNIDIEQYIPQGVTEIVSGGAKGVDALAKQYATNKNIKYTEFPPDYSKFKKYAPLKRNEKIASYSDGALVFWDSASKGTQHTINCFKKQNKDVILIIVGQNA